MQSEIKRGILGVSNIEPLDPDRGGVAYNWPRIWIPRVQYSTVWLQILHWCLSNRCRAVLTNSVQEYQLDIYFGLPCCLWMSTWDTCHFCLARKVAENWQTLCPLFRPFLRKQRQQVFQLTFENNYVLYFGSPTQTSHVMCHVLYSNKKNMILFMGHPTSSQ